MLTKKTEAKAMIDNFQELVTKIKEMDAYDLEVARDEVSNQIDLMMKKERVSKAELARRLGKSRAYVTKILQGNTNFTLDTLVKIAKVLEYKFTPVFVPKGMEWKPAEEVHLYAKASRTATRMTLDNEDYVQVVLNTEEGENEGNTDRIVG